MTSATLKLRHAFLNGNLFSKGGGIYQGPDCPHPEGGCARLLIRMSSEQPYHFIHIHKTAGTSVRMMLLAQFPHDAVYPTAQDEEYLRAARLRGDMRPEIVHLSALSERRRRSIRLLCGHYPLVADTLLSTTPKRLTFLRDPVERAISHLRHVKTHIKAMQTKPLPEIFEVLTARKLFLNNHQTRFFAYRSVEEASLMTPFDLDTSRLDLAKANLAKCEFVGITERFDQSIALAERVFGWRLGSPLRQNATLREDVVDDDLRARISKEVQFDIELYRFACELNAECLAKFGGYRRHLSKLRRLLGA